MTIITLLLALARLVPMILEMIRDGRIKDATEKEVLGAIETEFQKRWQARVDAAVAAGNRVHTDTVTSEGNTEADPFDRSRRN